jgi:hypothetical protein
MIFFPRSHPRLWPAVWVYLATALWATLNRPSSKQPKRPERPPGDSAGLPPDIPGEVIDLVRQGKKIQAIKRYRQLISGVGLKDAKDIIDQI